jgi:hypothetical protein
MPPPTKRRRFIGIDVCILLGMVVAVVLVRHAVAVRPSSVPSIGGPRLPDTYSSSAEAGIQTTTTVPAVPTDPLTSLPTIGSTAPHRAIAVKVDGFGGVPAVYGVEQADLVLEELVEGGLVRMIATFHSLSPGRVGPVRSVRTSDLQILGALGRPVLAFSGGNPRTLSDTLAGPFLPFPPLQRPGERTYWRDQRLRAPHNLFASISAIAASVETGTDPPRPFDMRPSGAPVVGDPAPSIVVPFSATTTTGFLWSGDRSTWIRFLDGEPQVDGSGAPLTAANVVVLWTPYGRSPYDAHSPEAHPVGAGRADVYTTGVVQHGTWTRAGPDDQWHLQRDDGSAIYLEPGRTWVELAPDGPPAGVR